jgi:hypothetical protein
VKPTPCSTNWPRLLSTAPAKSDANHITSFAAKNGVGAEGAMGEHMETVAADMLTSSNQSTNRLIQIW